MLLSAAGPLQMQAPPDQQWLQRGPAAALPGDDIVLAVVPDATPVRYEDAQGRLADQLWDALRPPAVLLDELSSALPRFCGAEAHRRLQDAVCRGLLLPIPESLAPAAPPARPASKLHMLHRRRIAHALRDALTLSPRRTSRHE